MTDTRFAKAGALAGKVGLVMGIANDRSIAWGCAEACRGMGAELAVTYQSAKAEPFVRPLAEKLRAAIVAPCNVETPAEMEALFGLIRARWGRLDFVLHSIAFAPKADLQGRVTDCTAEGFALAMDVSVHSFIRVARLAEPLMPQGGSLICMSYYGAEKVVEHYNLMGPVKAALEAVTRSLAVELGPRRIRVNAISPGPLATRAASGIEHFDDLLNLAAARAPEHRLVTIAEVGALAGYLVSDAARGLTGEIIHLDAGYHIAG